MADGDQPERRIFVFALRDRLPLGDGGWTMLAHERGCATEDDELTLACQAGGPCYATYLRFVPTDDIDNSFVLAGRDIATAAAELGGASDIAATFDDELEGFPTHRWVAVTSTPTCEDDGPSDVFDRSFGMLHDAVAALRHATNAPVPDMTIERMHPLYLAGWSDATGATEIAQVVLVEHTPPGPPEPATAEQLRSAEAFFAGRRNRNPAELYRDQLLATTRAAHAEGDYPKAILSAATAAEVLIKQTAWMLSYEASLSDVDPAPDAVRSRLGKMKPSQLVGGVLAPRLGGSWNSADPAKPMGAWREHVARARNRVIHRGYRPNGGEADEAVNGLRAAETHVMDRLAARATTYPRTAFTLLGPVGIERRGLTRKMQATLADVQGGPEHFLGGFRSFVEALDEGMDDF